MKQPIISRVTEDPARFNGRFKRVDLDIENRFKKLKVDLKKLLKTHLVNLSTKKLTGNVSLELFDAGFSVNAQLWEYDLLTPSNLAMLNELIQELIDTYLISKSLIDPDFFLEQYLQLSTEAAARDVYNNLSGQSQDYAESTTIRAVLQSQSYSDVLVIASTQSLDDYKSLSDDLKRKISYLITEGAAAGVSPYVLADEIVKQGVSPGRAKNIARTEMIGAYRKARIAETERYKEQYGVKSAYMWLSALSPSTRPSHARRHGKLYTKEEIADFYRKNGNKFNCKCSFTEVLLGDDGEPISKKLKERLANQRKQWIEKLENE